jgi:hypothetical protein
LPGEVFDITCFTGISQYPTVRTEGQCSPSSLSSIHIRAVDFELSCAPDPDISEPALRKADFEKQTRDKHLTSLTYMASIDLAYEDSPNHESITPNSFACLQCTRDNFKRLDTVEFDPSADIVTVIIDTVTDKRHLHFVKAGTSASTSANFEKVHHACTACTA